MSNKPNNRQRLRRERTVFRGPNGKISMESEEHSIFFEDGNIGSKETHEMLVVLGKLPHDFKSITSQCQTCHSFATDDMAAVCGLCNRVVCLPCSQRREGLTVCPSCASYLERRRKILILRKLIIDPFVERKG